MTRFENGPAASIVLMLKRSPKYLRACRSERTPPKPARDSRRPVTHWDALDQPSDTPNPDETLFAYILDRNEGSMHVCKSGGGGFYPMSFYRFVPNQPDQDTMFDAGKWAEWVQQQP